MIGHNIFPVVSRTGRVRMLGRSVTSESCSCKSKNHSAPPPPPLGPGYSAASPGTPTLRTLPLSYEGYMKAVAGAGHALAAYLARARLPTTHPKALSAPARQYAQNMSKCAGHAEPTVAQNFLTIDEATGESWFLVFRGMDVGSGVGAALVGWCPYGSASVGSEAAGNEQVG